MAAITPSADEPLGPRDNYGKVRASNAPTVKPILYKYMSVDTAFKVISAGTVMRSSPMLFNDPFDGGWNSGWQIDREDFLPAVRLHAMKILKGEAKIPENATPQHRTACEAFVKKLCSMRGDSWPHEIEKAFGPTEPRTQSLHPMIHDGVRELSRRLRVFCLCDNKTSVTMWSHYADHHRGVVLGFDTRVLEDEWKTIAEPVEYPICLPEVFSIDQLLATVMFGCPLPDTYASLRSWVTTKAPEWAYEKEWRLFDIVGRMELGCRDAKCIPRGVIREIVLGCRVDATAAAELVAIARPLANQLSVSRMALHATKLSLHEDPVRTLFSGAPQITKQQWDGTLSGE